MPGTRPAQARRVEGGNFTDVYELRCLTPGGGELRVAARVFRTEARPGTVQKLSVVLPAAAAAGVPVPELLWADPCGDLLRRPLLLLRWIDGTPFSDAPESTRASDSSRPLSCASTARGSTWRLTGPTRSSPPITSVTGLEGIPLLSP